MASGQTALTVTVLGYWGTYPGPGEATTGFLVEHGATKILLDCVSGVLAQLLRLCDVKDLSAVVVTHHHHDHVADLGVLTYAVLLSRLMKTRSEKLPVYMPLPPSDMKQSLGAEPLIELCVVDEHAIVTVDEVSLRFARTEHPVDCLAVRMEAGNKVFVFSADAAWHSASSEAVRQGLSDLASGADLFVCEASMYQGQESDAKGAGHMTAPQAGLLGRAAGVRRLALTHYPHYGDHRDLQTQAEATYRGPVELLSTRQVLTV